VCRPSADAAARARASSRDAIATTSENRPRCMAGITFSVAIFATPRTPQRTFFRLGVTARWYYQAAMTQTPNFPPAPPTTADQKLLFTPF
jgi:hypothetical protein